MDKSFVENIVQDDLEVVDGSVIRDSILENKDKTKIYWEQKMMAAATETSYKNDINDLITAKHKDLNELSDNASEATGSSKRNSISSTENGDDYVNLELKRVKEEKHRIEREIRLNKEREKGRIVGDNPLHTIESKIALELQEMREREEELRRFRRQQALSAQFCKDNTETKDIQLTSVSVEESFHSIPTTDEGNFSEYGSEEKEQSLDGNNSRVITPDSQVYSYRRTQSMDSVSSGHSTGSDRDSPRRKITVKPYEDNEEEAATQFISNENETPIEKEIRLAKEREEELKREKGISVNNDQIQKIELKNKVKNARNAISNDPRGVEHRLATNRIQQEIDETFEREKELRTEGKILTTSEETVDSKVTRLTELVEYSISEGMHKRKMKRSASTPHLLSALKSEELTAPSNLTRNNRKHSVPTSNPIPATRKFTKNPAQKVSMQRFIQNGGLVLSTNFNNNNNVVNHSYTATTKYNTMGPTHKKLLNGSSVTQSVPPVRKGYVSTEEKIQEELKEMKRREEELRTLRCGSMFGSSQPNLSTMGINDNEDEAETSWTSHSGSQKLSAVKISLTNNATEEDGILTNKTTGGKRRQSSRIAEWESRIQNAANLNG